MTEIEIDPSTGLPELPEGLFWRVGDNEMGKATVFLMNSEALVEHHRIVEVYGENWWNRNTIVGTTKEAYCVKGEEVVKSICLSMAVIWKEYTDTHPAPEGTLFLKRDFMPVLNVPVCPEGVAYVADFIWWKRTNDQEREQRLQEEAKMLQEEKNRIYGDYPPKKWETV